MSNHDIGHAMNQVIETILDLYDEGAYSVDTAKTLINKAVYVVCGYDGNDYEALEYVTDTHCSCCLKAYADHEFFITPDEANECITAEDHLGRFWWYEGCDAAKSLDRSLCEDCFRKIFKDVLSAETMERILRHARE